MLRKIVSSPIGACLISSVPGWAIADDADFSHDVRHVLLISVDGLHALDLANLTTHPDSALAQLSRHGVTYTNNSTSTPSDSFPGLASLVNGGSPVTSGRRWGHQS